MASKFFILLVIKIILLHKQNLTKYDKKNQNSETHNMFISHKTNLPILKWMNLFDVNNSVVWFWISSEVSHF